MAPASANHQRLDGGDRDPEGRAATSRRRIDCSPDGPERRHADPPPRVGTLRDPDEWARSRRRPGR
jgi:hypothetical protein